jgi:hypothetical protein
MVQRRGIGGSPSVKAWPGRQVVKYRDIAGPVYPGQIPWVMFVPSVLHRCIKGTGLTRNGLSREDCRIAHRDEQNKVIHL